MRSATLILEAATIFMAAVIFFVLPTDLIRIFTARGGGEAEGVRRGCSGSGNGGLGQGGVENVSRTLLEAVPDTKGSHGAAWGGGKG